jgi:hypothetical protein
MLDERPPAFAERDLFLLGLLGLLARRADLDRALQATEPDPVEHPIVDALLGLVVLGERLEGWCEAMATPAFPALEAPHAPLNLRALLRSA